MAIDENDVAACKTLAAQLKGQIDSLASEGRLQSLQNLAVAADDLRVDATRASGEALMRRMAHQLEAAIAMNRECVDLVRTAFDRHVQGAGVSPPQPLAEGAAEVTVIAQRVTREEFEHGTVTRIRLEPTGAMYQFESLRVTGLAVSVDADHQDPPWLIEIRHRGNALIDWTHVGVLARTTRDAWPMPDQFARRVSSPYELEDFEWSLRRDGGGGETPDWIGVTWWVECRRAQPRRYPFLPGGSHG